MKPLIQTVMENGKGNCLAACIASILEVPIESVPDLGAGTFLAVMDEYLKTKGIVPVWVHAVQLASAWVGNADNYCILVGRSPRTEGVSHAVVGKPNGYGFKIIHDPHPDGTGIKGEVTSVIFLGRSDLVEACDGEALGPAQGRV